MKNIRFLIVLIFSTISSAQIKGVVKDSITGKPIPYVSIWVENKNIGVTTETDGSFEIDCNEKDKIIFSILGYYDEINPINKNGIYFLIPKVYDIQEVVIIPKKNTKTIELGNSKRSNLSHLQGKHLQILAKHFNNEYVDETLFLKEIIVWTKSPIKDATFKLRIFEFDTVKKLPSTNLLKELIVVKVKKGQHKNLIDISQYNIKFPKNGVVIGVENIICKENEYFYSNKALEHDRISYAPQIVFNYEEEENSYIFINFKWSNRKKHSINYGKHKGKNLTIEPAINLTLTN